MKNKRVTALAALALLVALRSFLHELPHHHSAAPPPARLAPPVGRRREATPILASSKHKLPFAIYSISCAETQNCATATIVGQLEGACDARERTLERASLNDWAEWRADFEKKHRRSGCKVCVASEWKTKVRRAVAQALNEEYASRSPSGGYLAKDRVSLDLYCAYSSSGGEETVVKSSTKDLATFLRRRSTLVFECPVPPSLRRAALDDLLDVRIAPHKDLKGAYPKLPLLVQRSVKWPEHGPKIGACAWVKGGAYHDRDGNLLGLPAARVAEWLAHLRVLGVGHVLITDNSDNVFAKALNGISARETSPLKVAYDGFESITVVPWPSLDDDRDGCDPSSVEARILRESNATSTTQSLFGRPAQYAAQNTCHRRLVAAGAQWVTHNDVDEFLVPPPSLNAEQYLMELVKPFGDRKMPPRALALPCVFFAPCRIDNHGMPVGRSDKMLLSEGTCAGKAQLHRQKLIAHASVTHLWVHYAFAAKAGVGDVIYLLPEKQLMLAHLRLGYSFDSALASRAVDNFGEITATEEKRFVELYNDRLSAGGETCIAALRNTEKFWNALTPAQRKARAAESILERTKRNRRETGLGISDCDLLGEDMFGWCWCVDDAPARLALRTRAELVARWDISKMRREVDAAWPALAAVPNAPTRGW